METAQLDSLQDAAAGKFTDQAKDIENVTNFELSGLLHTFSQEYGAIGYYAGSLYSRITCRRKWRQKIEEAEVHLADFTRYSRSFLSVHLRDESALIFTLKLLRTDFLLHGLKQVGVWLTNDVATSLDRVANRLGKPKSEIAGDALIRFFAELREAKVI